MGVEHTDYVLAEVVATLLAIVRVTKTKSGMGLGMVDPFGGCKKMYFGQTCRSHAMTSPRSPRTPLACIVDVITF
jgi:hypothetical protein